uniref:Uncharacterized protein n=1 Tax=Ciona savignyi TaxID=51511 RepID=H2YVH6_CIOSA
MGAAGASSLPDSYQSMFTGAICFKTGLFKFSYSILSVEAALALPMSSMDSFVRVTIGLLFFSMLLIIVGVIFIIMSSCSDSMSHRRKAAARTYNVIGAVVLTFGAIFLLGGALAYTVPQSKVVHNPIMWTAQLGTTFSKVFSNGMSGSGSMNPFGPSGTGGSNPYAGFGSSPGGSSSNNPLAGLENLGSNIDPSSMPNLEDIMGQGRKKRQAPGSSSDPMPELANLTPVEDSSPRETMHESSPGAGGMQDAMKYLSSIDPVFGYSFYLAWVAFVLAFLAAILGVLAWCRVASEYPDSIPLDGNIGKV